METIVFVIVTFFGADPIGVLIEKPYQSAEECRAVAAILDALPGKTDPTHSFCIKKLQVKAAQEAP